MTKLQRKYIPDVTKQMATAEANYMRLLKLLGDLDTFVEASIYWQLKGVLGEEHLHITLVERFNYTLTLHVDFFSQQPWGSALLTVRVYQDMLMAEVVKNNTGKQYQGSYRYPNDQGVMPDEKAQLNLFFQSLLQQAKSQGLVMRQPMSVT